MCGINRELVSNGPSSLSFVLKVYELESSLTATRGRKGGREAEGGGETPCAGSLCSGCTKQGRVQPRASIQEPQPDVPLEWQGCKCFGYSALFSQAY